MTKVVALYLPQFYETEYNNEWWGKGYTEWVAVKNAKPLFKGHCQPRIPKDNWYYDLSVKENIKKQIDLAKQYGIDGFAIYQYYSCGNKLLEVPTEIILNNSDLDIGFYLFWANHDWKKGWFGQESGVLWAQKYGSEKEWRDQFEYCLKFFKDPRYICVDNKPVYGIFQAFEFTEAERFIECWNKWAKEEGFDGIYFIKSAHIKDRGELGKFDAIVAREPFYTFSYDEGFLLHVYRFLRTRLLNFINKKILLPRGKGIVKYRVSYDWTWKKILSRNYSDGKLIPGAFTDWDNSPRKNYNSYVIDKVTPEKFRRYYTKLYEKAITANSEFILFNAWNEWAEGAYLEPDEKNGYAFLEAIRDVKESFQNHG